MALLGALIALPPALAAPDRLNDDVPDAVPDPEGALAASFGYQALQLEGPLNSNSAAQQLFKLRYTFSPDVAASFRYQNLSLTGGPGLFTPIYDNADGATALDFDLGVNLLNVPATAEDKAKNVAWAAGSAFGIGLNAARYGIDQGPVSQDDTLLKAYLVYSTDLTEKLRAHTYFSSGRLTGDSHSGSVNRIAGGLDYTLTPGCRPLVLMVNGVLDVYNFRQPSFNTNRITRFDFGMRYRFTEDWYASLGWTTLNDSESDSSGSGIFAGLNFVDEPPCCEPCAEIPAPPAADPNAPPAPAAPPQASAAGRGPATPAVENAGSDNSKLLMAQVYPEGAAEPGKAAASLDAAAAAPDPSTVAAPLLAQSPEGGIAIPVLESEAPPPTPEGLLMARAPAQAERPAEPEPKLLALTSHSEDAKSALGPAPGGRPSSKQSKRQMNAERSADSADEDSGAPAKAQD